MGEVDVRVVDGCHVRRLVIFCRCRCSVLRELFREDRRRVLMGIFYSTPFPSATDKKKQGEMREREREREDECGGWGVRG